MDRAETSRTDRERDAVGVCDADARRLDQKRLRDAFARALERDEALFDL